MPARGCTRQQAKERKRARRWKRQAVRRRSGPLRRGPGRSEPLRLRKKLRRSATSQALYPRRTFILLGRRSMNRGTLSYLVRHLQRVTRNPSAPDLTDGELLERFRAHHEEAAFAVLLQRHGPMVLGICRRVLGNDELAEDAFQATF